jgi:nucleoside-diphosphate-sugar epimerase
MKILITGGTGFLGRHLVWRMAAEGHEVIFTGRDASAADLVISHCAAPVKWHAIEHGSASAKSILINAAKDVDAIVHCAALSSPWGSMNEFICANVDSTVEILAAGEAADINRLVHISTPSVYFDFRHRINIKESEILPEPVNNYARTKAQAEQLVMASKIQSVILRPRALFGSWDNTLMPRLLRVMAHGPIPLINGGKAIMDITYIDNVVDAIYLALTQPLKRSCSVYNLSNGEPMAFVDLLEKLATHFKLPLRTQKMPWPVVDIAARLFELHARVTHAKEPLLTRYSAGVLAFSQTLDISAICDELGYSPKISIDEGIKRHAAWHAENQE